MSGNPSATSFIGRSLSRMGGATANLFSWLPARVARTHRHTQKHARARACRMQRKKLPGRSPWYLVPRRSWILQSCRHRFCARGTGRRCRARRNGRERRAGISCRPTGAPCGTSASMTTRPPHRNIRTFAPKSETNKKKNKSDQR